jgi:MFS family permease
VGSGSVCAPAAASDAKPVFNCNGFDETDPAAAGGYQETVYMIATITPIFALLLSISLLLMGNGLQGTLLPVRASIESFSAIDIGILGSSYFLGFAAGCVYGPYLVRRVGHIRTFTAMATIASCAVLVHAFILSPLVWWLLRAATGVCFAVLYMVIESWLNEKSSNENRGTIFSIYTIINLTVVTLGQMMLTLDKPTNFMLFSIASILVSLAAVPVALSKSAEPAPIETVKINFRQLYQTSPVGVIGCLGVGLTNGAFWALAPVFAKGGADEATTVAIFMSVAVIAGAVGQWPLGRMSDRMDRRRVILLSCTGAVCAAALLAVLDPGLDWMLLPTAFAYGLFAFPLYSLCVAHTNDFAEKNRYVEVACGLLLVYAIGAVIGPIVASVFMRFIGSGGLFAFTALTHVGVIVYVVHRLRTRAVAPMGEHIAFSDAMRVAGTISSVDSLSHPEEERSGGQ